ncbi:MAG: glycoside hydrolase family 2 protein [Acidobacteria bacterium]|nr:glycoside hydrolase family 2 protein [Acidobacteriota bacterium]
MTGPFGTGWQLRPTEPGLHAEPGPWMNEGPWASAVVPGTVAQTLGLSVDQPGAFDSQDWWYRTTLNAEGPGTLNFEGLATLAEVWLDGRFILQSRNMFRPHEVDLPDLGAGPHELVIRFRSLEAELAGRRPRPRWKTSLVRNQNLRWIRTTLLGRIPGWTPPIQAVGPWRAVTWTSWDAPAMRWLDLRTWAVGTTGRVELKAVVRLPAQWAKSEALLRVGKQQLALRASREGDALHLEGAFDLPEIPLWWPHTHGAPQLLDAAIELSSEEGNRSFPCGRVGFKAVQVERAGGLVQVRVNGVAVFARGACWTTSDMVTLAADPPALRASLTAARDAGANMLRVGGTMTYETEAFYTLCDELGLMVWQDFMFANMDYPFGDEPFRADVEAEIVAQLSRLQKHPCITVYCGSSEIEQQAAMLGLPRPDWSSPFFATELPATCARLHPGIPYFPSTPCEGALPFHTGTGLTHYYGVGAYRRPLADARAAAVKFTPECLGFSHVPDAATMDHLSPEAPLLPHQPLWKARVPRDSGAGWDFEDVRDHYLREGFGVDPVALRAADPEGYYARSRVVTGELIRRTYAEWRRAGSTCGGALVWFWNDLWPGAGWGLLDSLGRPKAAYWYARRAWAPRSIHLSDEGLDGLGVHVVNDSPAPLEAQVELELWQGPRTSVGKGSEALRVAPFSTELRSADALLGTFTDITYAYRFGPPKHHATVARLRDAVTGDVISEDVHFPSGLALAPVENVGWRAEVQVTTSTELILKLSGSAFLQSVAVEAPGWRPDDDYFHLVPGQVKHLRFTALGESPRRFKAHLSALNTAETLTVRGPE